MRNSNHIFIIVGGLGGETTEVKNYYKIFKSMYPKFKIYIYVLYSLTGNEFIKNDDVIIVHKAKRTINPFGKILNIINWLISVRKIKREIRPFISFSLGDPSNLVNILTSQNNEKIILRFSGPLSTIGLYQGNSRIYDRLYKYLYGKIIYKLYDKKASLITSISKFVKDDIESYYHWKQNIKVIYNPYPLNDIKLKAREEVETIFENIPYIITVGRLTQQKGQWYLLRVFKKLKEYFPDLRLLILGEGELKDYLVKLSEELKLKTFVWDRDKLSENFDVYFLGFHKNPFKYVSRAKLFVFPSLWEGFGNALVEAMACGVPVVSTDCKSGPREILAPDTDYRKTAESVEFAKYGVLVPPFEVKYKRADEPLEEKELMLFEAVKTLLENEELRKKYADLGLERAKDFDIEEIVKEWETLLEELS